MKACGDYAPGHKIQIEHLPFYKITQNIYIPRAKNKLFCVLAKSFWWLMI
jgi:hypothetical protein